MFLMKSNDIEGLNSSNALINIISNYINDYVIVLILMLFSDYGTLSNTK
jgi:hypothetical protein